MPPSSRRTRAQRPVPSLAGDVPRRRIATQEEVRFPLQHGYVAPFPSLRPAPRPPRGTGLKLLVPRWRREVRIKKGNHRWQGETWYYGPCGKRMKQFPEVIKVWSPGRAGWGPTWGQAPPALPEPPDCSRQTLL